MKNVILSSVVALTLVAGAAHAAPTAKKGVRVVSAAKALNTAEKASVTGMDCECPEPATKPGYGFGAKVEHYGPPGQGFSTDLTWREHRDAGNVTTPKGNPLPPKAFRVTSFPSTGGAICLPGS